MIGIFDSGVGGMTVAFSIEKAMPSYSFIYFGDLARTPYGSKSPETIIKYSIENTEFLISKGAKAVIIACNSAASVASDLLRELFDIPIFEVITPAITEAIKSSVSRRIGVIGTRATISSGVYEKKLRQLSPDVKVYSQACPLLVPLVEEGWLNKRETKMILRRYITPLKLKQIDSLVLGCTHYPLLKEIIRPRIGKNNVELIDSSIAVANEVRSFIENNPDFEKTLCKNGNNIHFVSDITESAKSIAHKIFGRKIQLIKP